MLKNRLYSRYQKFEMSDEKFANAFDDISPEGWTKLIDHLHWVRSGLSVSSNNCS